MLDLAGIFTINAALALFSVPFLWNLVPRNYLYGFRFAATLRDDEVWYPVNRHVARRMVAVGVPLAILTALADAGGYDTTLVRTTLAVITMTTMLAIVVDGWRLSWRLADQRRRTHQGRRA